MGAHRAAWSAGHPCVRERARERETPEGRDADREPQRERERERERQRATQRERKTDGHARTDTDGQTGKHADRQTGYLLTAPHRPRRHRGLSLSLSLCLPVSLCLSLPRSLALALSGSLPSQDGYGDATESTHYLDRNCCVLHCKVQYYDNMSQTVASH